MRAALKFIVLFLWLAAGAVQAQDRIALVVGNSQYGSVSPLENSGNDARLIAASLEELEFKVTLVLDGTQVQLKRAIAQFGRELRNAGGDSTGLFYYAGHGVQSFGTNYLLPVDVELFDAADLDLVAIEAQSVLRQMYSARNKTNIMILDACRNNPFTNIPEFNDSGLAEMQAPTGTFLAYATAPGGVALDGLDGNSPFTRALAEHMSTPGEPIEQMFKDVRVDVLEMTDGKQTPWDTSSLTSDFVFARQAPMSAADLEALQLWNSVKVSKDPVQIMLFLRGYPESAYVADAKALLAEVMEQELAGNAPKKPAEPPAGPSDAEQKMFQAAQSEGSASGYQAYLQAFPKGIFAEFAKQELAALKADGTSDPVGQGGQAEAETATAPSPKVTDKAPTTVTFDQPFDLGLPGLENVTIADIVKQSPMFPPVEGLPEEYWKDKTCSNCHQWTKERLCEQSNVYLSLNMQRSLDKQHPFGGALKRNLKTWAAGGCK